MLSSHCCCLVAHSCLTHGPQRRLIHSVCSAVEEDGILVSGSKVYVSHHLYIYFYCYHYFYYYSYQYDSLRIKVCIFRITQPKNHFLLQHWLIRNISQIAFLITQNDSHTTPPTWHFAHTFLTYLVLSSFLCALTLDPWLRAHLASLLGSLSLCPPIIFSIAFVPAHHSPCCLVPRPSLLSTSHLPWQAPSPTLIKERETFGQLASQQQRFVAMCLDWGSHKENAVYFQKILTAPSKFVE